MKPAKAYEIKTRTIGWTDDDGTENIKILHRIKQVPLTEEMLKKAEPKGRLEKIIARARQDQ